MGDFGFKAVDPQVSAGAISIFWVSLSKEEVPWVYPF